MTKGGGTAAKAILTPWRLGTGYLEGSVFLFSFGGVSIFLIFFSGSEARDSWFGSHSRRGGRSGRSGGGSGVWLWSGWEQMAPDLRVPAAAVAPRERPASVRRGGWTRRAEGASIHPPLRWACGFSPPGNGALPHSSFGGCLWGRLWEREAWKIQAPFLGLWGGVRAIMPLTLKKGRDIPHLSFSPVKWKLRKTHSLKCPSPSSQGLPWESGRGDLLLFSFHREEPTTVGSLVPQSGAGTYVWGCVLREMPSEVFSSCWCRC